MNALIIDDEILNIKNLEILIRENFSQLNLLNSFVDAEAASNFINSNHIDLIFLDINMPNQDGFDLLDLFPERSFDVIFVTAYEEYALKALKAGASDYILKPILLTELKTAIQKVLKKYNEKIELNKYKLSSSKKIKLSYSGGTAFVEDSDILYIQGIDNLSKIFLKNNQKYIVSKTLKSFCELLNEDLFFRIHKSFLVNLDSCIQIISKEKHFLELSNKAKIPISRRKLKAFSEKLGQN